MSEANDYLAPLLAFAGVIGVKTAIAPIKNMKIWSQTHAVADPFQVYQDHGIKPYFRGHLIDTMRYIPTQALGIFTKRKIAELAFEDEDGSMSLLGEVVSGSIGFAVSLAVLHPLENIRTHITYDVSGETYNGFVDTAKTLHKDGALYNGFATTILGVLPYKALYSLIYRYVFDKLGGLTDESILKKFIACQFVVMCAQASTYPFELIRRSQMMTGKGIADTISTVYNNDGILGFYSGFSFNLLSSVTAALGLLVYDVVKLNFSELFGTDRKDEIL
eukprot:TRINITY_DN35_c0_g1_i1.p1 TRINITY_DN35_c0_g1~~TRINITY_DN35_c0_g1_i1.p1  ORF type:complete len:290 (-),score=57.51 TRINITY_DN35_c0_g1_i1:43-870(-)